MKLSLISETDFDKRSAQRMGGGAYIVQLLRSGEITMDDIKAAAVLGNSDAKDFMDTQEPGSMPNWSRPHEMSKHIYSIDKLPELINVLLNLTGQSLLKVKRYTANHWSELDAEQQERVQEGLEMFKEALVYCRNPEIPMSQQLQQDFSGYGGISNWQYWSQIVGSTSLPAPPAYGGRGDYDTYKIGTETHYNDPKTSDVTIFKGSNPPSLRNLERHSEELHPTMMVMGSLALAIDAIETLTQHSSLVAAREENPDANYIMTTDQVMANQVGRAIKGLAPIIGKSAIQKRLIPVVAPAL